MLFRSTQWGESTPIVTSTDESAIVWSDEAVTVDATAGDVVLAQSGTNVGTATYTVDGTDVVVPLRTAADLSDPGFWWRISHPGLVFG